MPFFLTKAIAVLCTAVYCRVLGQLVAGQQQRESLHSPGEMRDGALRGRVAVQRVNTRLTAFGEVAIAMVSLARRHVSEAGRDAAPHLGGGQRVLIRSSTGKEFPHAPLSRGQLTFAAVQG